MRKYVFVPSYIHTREDKCDLLVLHLESYESEYTDSQIRKKLRIMKMCGFKDSKTNEGTLLSVDRTQISFS